MSGFGFSYSDHQEQTGGDFEPVPPGQYEVIIDRAEQVKTKGGDDNLKVTFKVLGGDYDGRLVFENFVYGHPNEKVANIARSKMAAICRVMGKEANTADEFVGAVLNAKISVQPKKGEYPASNRLDRVIEGKGANAGDGQSQSAPTVTKKPW